MLFHMVEAQTVCQPQIRTGQDEVLREVGFLELIIIFPT
jgi:hypothetical protein